MVAYIVDTDHQENLAGFALEKWLEAVVDAGSDVSADTSVDDTGITEQFMPFTAICD